MYGCGGGLTTSRGVVVGVQCTSTATTCGGGEVTARQPQLLGKWSDPPTPIHHYDRKTWQNRSPGSKVRRFRIFGIFGVSSATVSSKAYLVTSNLFSGFDWPIRPGWKAGPNAQRCRGRLAQQTAFRSEKSCRTRFSRNL